LVILDKNMPIKDEKIKTLVDVITHFHLMYGSLRIGTLSMDHGKWRFEYSDEFRQHGSLRPIVEFPDLSKVYESDELWSSFLVRIPSFKQPTTEEIKVDLLKRFGERTIVNPFRLIEVA
jgi:hypothetical protein